MSTGVPQNVWGVQATVSVETSVASAAASALTTALTDIKTALTTLANGTEFSAPEINGVTPFDESDGANGVFSVSECQLIVGAITEATAQTAATAAQTAINTAIAGLSPTVTVTLEAETDGAEGGFVLSLLQ
jgi:hypothetical protein